VSSPAERVSFYEIEGEAAPERSELGEKWGARIINVYTNSTRLVERKPA
jgi:hypothetical protein